MKISVVICTYNRDKFLPECLDHLKKQDAEADDFEILIVNNKSTDNTKQISLEFIELNPRLNVRYVEEVVENPEYSGHTAFGGKVIPRYNPGKEPKWLTPYLEGLVSKVDLGDDRKPFEKKYPAVCNMVLRADFF